MMEEKKEQEREEERLDKILVARGLVSNRTRAEAMIRNVGVQVNGKLINKTGKKFPINSTINLLQQELKYVSRDALKLEKAVEVWKLNIKDKIAMDVGASTGGFTEILIKNGAQKVFAVDVGQNQLHKSLIENANVVNLEKTHVRELTKKKITEEIDICVIDVSFISLTKIFPFIHQFLKDNAEVVALIKPQFEVGKENVGKGGIVKNKALYLKTIEDVKESARVNFLQFNAYIDSPILAGDGNKEFIGLWTKLPIT